MNPASSSSLSPPPIPSRSTQRLSSGSALTTFQGVVVASLGAMPFVRTVARVVDGTLTLDVVDEGKGFSVSLQKAFVRLDDVIEPYHVVVVPKPGSLMFPSLRLDSCTGDKELRMFLFNLLDKGTSDKPAELWKNDGVAFVPCWDKPAHFASLSIKKKWFSRTRSMRVKRSDDGVVVWELRGHNGAYKSVELLPVLEQGKDAAPCMFGSESVLLPIKSYAVWTRYDDWRFLPWLRQLPLLDGRRMIAAVSRPWLAHQKSYSAEVRFPRSMGTWLQEPDMVVSARAEEEEFDLVFACTNTTVASVTILSKGRYKVVLASNSGFPVEVLLMLVLLVDKVVHDPSSFATVNNLVGKTQVGSIANKLTTTKIGGKILDALDL